MFFRLIGILWILLGIFWILRPQYIKRRFSKMVRKSRRKFIFIASGIMLPLFFSAAKASSGIWAKIFLIFALIGIFKTIFFVTSKAGDKVIEWWMDKPLWLWRVWALSIILVGILFQKVQF